MKRCSIGRFNSCTAEGFLGLFRRLIQQRYLQTLLLFQNPDLVYAGQQLTFDGATVDTKIVTPRDQFDLDELLVLFAYGLASFLIAVGLFHYGNAGRS